MSPEQSFRQLIVQPLSLCRHCRRTFITSARRTQQQSATGAFTELLQASQQEEKRRRTSSGAALPRAPTPAAAPTLPDPPSTSSGDNAAFDVAKTSVREATRSRRQALQSQALADLERNYTRKDLEQQQARRWKMGDVYAPHDLTGIEQAKWKKTKRREQVRSNGRDVLDMLGMNPIDHYKNFSMMSEYVSDTGRIKHSIETGLRPVNQRKMAKAIRRAVGIGLMPSVYRHPEILRKEMERRRAM